MKNIPNILTTLRFLLIIVFIYVFFSAEIDNNFLWSVIVFLVAGITDLLDGYIARKYNQITNFGKLMDPLADKLMLLTVLICLYSKDMIPLTVLLIIGIKELLMVFGATFMLKKKKVVQANIWGKAATLLFYIAVVFIVFDLPFSSTILITAVAVALFAFGQYVYLNFNAKGS